MNPARSAFAVLVCAAPLASHAVGVSPYMPLNLEPEIERQIERVLILGDKPVMTRPIAAATVLAALPRACEKDRPLCEQVGRYLARYTHDNALTHASVELSATRGADNTVPNRYGLHARSAWDASAQGYIQVNDFMLLAVGGVAYDGKQSPTGTMASLGFSWAQLDIGFRPHWFSPMSDSSMLISTEAPTMPSVTVSNYQPLTRLGLSYELFVGRMSRTDQIAFGNGLTSGNPRLTGLRIAMEPVSGWSLSLNRLMQYGGGARGQTGIRDLFNAFFRPSSAQTGPLDGQFGNQVASVTTRFLFPGKTPFAVYAEYAGEDTSRGRNYLLGNTALNVGIHFPRLWEHFDLTLETSEWQNAWYVHGIYQDGLINAGRVIGSWFGDQRRFRDAVGGHSQMVRLGWEPWFGGQLQLRWRTLQNQTYSGVAYRRASDLTVDYSRPWKGYTVGAAMDIGQDVFATRFSRLSGYIRFNEEGGLAASVVESLGGDFAAPDAHDGTIFVDAGLNTYRVRTDLTDGAHRITGPLQATPHLALGARRAVTIHSDLGTRIEFDEINHHGLIGVRLVDYRYRFDNPIALNAFLGAARYALATPAYGFFYGAGISWRNALPQVDVGVEYRFSDSVARDHLLPSDPPNQGDRNDSFYDVSSLMLNVSYHF